MVVRRRAGKERGGVAAEVSLYYSGERPAGAWRVRKG